jgi:hypothetical protein
VLVGENTQLKYPSLLTVRSESGKLSLENGTEINGDIIFESGETKSTKSQVHIAMGSIVNGTVNALGNMDCRGIVNGFTYCQKALVTTPSMFYTNHILNGRFNREELSPYHVSHIPYSKTSKIMTWLN